MNRSLIPKPAAFVTIGVAVILVLVPFHAFLTVWAASVFGHYTAWRLWKEFLLLPLAAMAAWLVCSSELLRREAGRSWLIRLVIAYVLLLALLGAAAYMRHAVSAMALAEGFIEDARLMVIFLVSWTAAAQSPWLRAHWQKLLLLPAAAVVAFGLLQLFLTADFLRHFGYSAATIRPYELIDQNSNFVRVQSFLRGANPLGAYLVVVLAALAAPAVNARAKRQTSRKRYWVLLLFGITSLVVLYFTYSRSAYLGTALAVFGVSWLTLKRPAVKRGVLVSVAVVCIAAGGSAVLFRHNTKFEDIFFHTSQLSRSPQSSNQNRTSALENGLRDVLHEPFGRGPGAAGPASVHNNHPARIAENYFLQIGEEMGWLGLALFITINGLLARELWRRCNNSDQLPLVLLGSFAGITVVNLLSHAWADDTIAYIWWGLAGVALAPGKSGFAP